MYPETWARTTPDKPALVTDDLPPTPTGELVERELHARYALGVGV